MRQGTDMGTLLHWHRSLPLFTLTGQRSHSCYLVDLNANPQLRTLKYSQPPNLKKTKTWIQPTWKLKRLLMQMQPITPMQLRCSSSRLRCLRSHFQVSTRCNLHQTPRSGAGIPSGHRLCKSWMKHLKRKILRQALFFLFLPWRICHLFQVRVCLAYVHGETLKYNVIC